MNYRNERNRSCVLSAIQRRIHPMHASEEGLCNEYRRSLCEKSVGELRVGRFAAAAGTRVLATELTRFRRATLFCRLGMSSGPGFVIFLGFADGDLRAMIRPRIATFGRFIQTRLLRTRRYSENYLGHSFFLLPNYGSAAM